MIDFVDRERRGRRPGGRGTSAGGRPRLLGERAALAADPRPASRSRSSLVGASCSSWPRWSRARMAATARRHAPCGSCPRTRSLYVHADVDARLATSGARGRDRAPAARPCAGCATGRSTASSRGAGAARLRDAACGRGSATRRRSRCCPTGARATSLILLQVADQAGRARFLRGAGESRTRAPTGASTVRVYGDLAAAFVGDFLAIGSPRNVRAAIDTRAPADSLGRDSSCFARRSTGWTPSDPIAYAYAPARGVAPAAARRSGGLVGADPVARSTPPGLRGRGRRRCARRATGSAAATSRAVHPGARRRRAELRPDAARRGAVGHDRLSWAPRGLDACCDQLRRISGAQGVGAAGPRPARCGASSARGGERR